MKQRRQHRIPIVLLTLVVHTATYAQNISGTVRDQTNAPIEGAIVSVQASGSRTTSDPNGHYVLPIIPGEPQVIVTAHKGYYNESVIVDAPAEGVDLLLEFVPQEDNVDYEMLRPLDCAQCHQAQLKQWEDSPMAKAGINTWVHDIYSGTGTPDGMGGFVYLRDSVFAASNSASDCASCHQPESWIQDPFSPLQDPALPPAPEVLHGISCEVCHKIADVDVAKINYPGIFPGAVTFTRPNDTFFHQVEYGVLGDSSFEWPNAMRPSYQPQLVAEVCAVCHQDANDINEDHTFNGVISEPTYLEWLDSPYGDPTSPLYATCVDCHMPPSGANQACETHFLDSPILRDPNTIRSHDILGTTPHFLENAVELKLQSDRVGDRLVATVDVKNSLTGHHVPTGVTVRNMILLVDAWNEEDGVPLEHAGEQTIHELGGVGNPAQGYYAGLPGKLYAKVNHNADGIGPTFFTDATGIQFDNRLPALATDRTSYTFAVPSSATRLHARARLIYRRAFRFLVDAKQWTEDGHGNPLEDVLPPHFGHLMEQAESIISTPTIRFTIERGNSPNEVILAWPSSQMVAVETSASVEGPWNKQEGTVLLQNERDQMVVATTSARRFFRLTTDAN